jgi:hypothetical protein
LLYQYTDIGIYRYGGRHHPDSIHFPWLKSALHLPATTHSAKPIAVVLITRSENVGFIEGPGLSLIHVGASLKFSIGMAAILVLGARSMERQFTGKAIISLVFLVKTDTEETRETLRIKQKLTHSPANPTSDRQNVDFFTLPHNLHIT